MPLSELVPILIKQWPGTSTIRNVKLHVQRKARLVELPKHPYPRQMEWASLGWERIAFFTSSLDPETVGSLWPKLDSGSSKIFCIVITHPILYYNLTSYILNTFILCTSRSLPLQLHLFLYIRNTYLLCATHDARNICTSIHLFAFGTSAFHLTFYQYSSCFPSQTYHPSCFPSQTCRPYGKRKDECQFMT